MEFYINEKISAEKTADFIASLAEKSKCDVHSILMYKDNELMLSLSPEPYSPHLRRQVYSVSKTLSATAIGILYDMGLVRTDDKLCDIFKDEMPENPSEQLLKLTVWNLLSMTVGHADCSMKKIAESDNGIREFLKLPIVFEPGTSYLYDTGASYMLSAVVTKITSLSLFDFLYIHLFNPLGISPTVWPFSGGKVNEGGLGLRLSADDYAKIALMYSNSGIYNGKRLLSEDWINQSFSPQSVGDPTRTADWCSGYGYQFWNCSRGGYRADGAFGQYVIIRRDENLVFVLFGESADVETELDLCFDFIDNAFNNDSDREKSIKIIEEKLSASYLPLSSDKTAIPLHCYMLDKNDNEFTLLNLSCDGEILKIAFSDGQAMRTITAGNGKWIENAFLAKKFVPQLYSLVPDERCDYAEFVASYTINTDGEITVKMRYTNNPHTSIMSIRYNDTLSLTVQRELNPHMNVTLTITGKSV